MQHEKSPCFVLHPAQLPLAETVLATQPCCSGLVFSVNRSKPAFAWLGSGRLQGPHLPFAKVGIWDPPASTDNLMKQLLSEEPDEPQGPRRGHTDEWYQQRCIFCADCKSTINSHYQKRGSRCQGCRRWFHASCIPATAPRAPGPEEAGEQQDAAAADADSTNGSSSRRSKRRNLFFHDDDCQEVHDRLAVVAAAGQQPFTLPDQRPFWQQLFSSAQPHEGHTWRLLDLSEVRPLYKDAQKRETLFRAHKKVQRQLDAAVQAAAEAKEAAKRSRGFGFGSKGSGAEGGEQGLDAAAAAGGARRSGKASSLDEFLTVSEVLKPLGETPRDLLEDSYAIIARDGSDGPAAVATFNVYGSDHARLQGVATPAYLQRQGNATRLVKQLELLLADAGVQQLAVILEPQDTKPKQAASQLLPSEAAQNWFARRLSFREASSEQKMLWRKDLPEYHKGLVGGCRLLVKPLSAGKTVVKGRSKTA